MAVEVRVSVSLPVRRMMVDDVCIGDGPYSRDEAHQFLLAHAQELLPRYLFRVQYPGCNTIHRTEGGLIAKATGKLNLELNAFRTSVESAFTWSSPVESPFINLFSIKQYAENWAKVRARETGEKHTVLIIDSEKLIGIIVWRLSHLVEHLGVTIPEKASQHIRHAFLATHTIPEEAIIGVLDTYDRSNASPEPKMEASDSPLPMATADPGAVICEICDAALQARKLLFQHLRYGHTFRERRRNAIAKGRPPKPWPSRPFPRTSTSVDCEICTQVFPQRSQLFKHIRRSHYEERDRRRAVYDNATIGMTPAPSRKRGRADTPVEEEGSSKRRRGPDGSHQAPNTPTRAFCTFCHKLYPSTTVLLKHVNISHKQEESPERDLLPTEPHLEMPQSGCAIPSICSKCKDSFPSRNRLVRHLVIHHRLSRKDAGVVSGGLRLRSGRTSGKAPAWFDGVRKWELPA